MSCRVTEFGVAEFFTLKTPVLSELCTKRLASSSHNENKDPFEEIACGC